MTEKVLGDEAFNVVLRDYKETSPLGKSLQNVVVISCKEYGVFCDIVEAVQEILRKNGDVV